MGFHANSFHQEEEQSAPHILPKAGQTGHLDEPSQEFARISREVQIAEESDRVYHHSQGHPLRENQVGREEVLYSVLLLSIALYSS